ncbi:hypothetical protein [Dactylosporangium cerinum]
MTTGRPGAAVTDDPGTAAAEPADAVAVDSSDSDSNNDDDGCGCGDDGCGCGDDGCGCGCGDGSDDGGGVVIGSSPGVVMRDPAG